MLRAAVAALTPKLLSNFFPRYSPRQGKEITKRTNNLARHLTYVKLFMLQVMHEQSMEFAFLSDTPQRKTKEGLISQVKRFWKETDGGAIPVALAAKILKCSPQGI